MGSELKKAVEKKALNPEFPYMPKAEWESRIKKARELMGKRGLDAVMILNNEDRLYFFGRGKPYKYEYPNVGIIPKKAPTTLIAETIDSVLVEKEGYVERNIGYSGDSQAPTPTAPDPVKLVAEVIEDLDLSNKTIGMEFGPFMWWEGFNINQWEQFKKELPRAKFVDATDLIWEMRMIKSEWEIEVMRYLYRATVKGYLQIINNAQPGKNEKDLFYDALKVWMELGIVDSMNYRLNVVHFSTHVSPYRDRVLKEGDFILFDGGPSYKGYVADVQRMLHIGDPGKEIRRLGRLANRAHEAVEDILKPGVTAGKIWMTGYSTIAKEEPRIWELARSKEWIGWVGHGEGLNEHELPYLVDGSDFILKEGMTISVEIPIFDIKGKMANMPEDVYLITKDGFEKLSKDFGPMDIYIKT
jgi:Xaa-Pro aminopeptidase